MMTRYLNLTLVRGPRPGPLSMFGNSDLTIVNWEPVLGATLLLASYSLQRIVRSNLRRHSTWVASLGLTVVGGIVLKVAIVPITRAFARAAIEVHMAEDDAVDRASAHSFPASDAPQFGR
jgi:hypothetical protein